MGDRFLQKLVAVISSRYLRSTSSLREAGARAPIERKKKNAVHRRQKLVSFGGTTPSGNVRIVWVSI